jgi:hypothetical protein
MAKSSTTLACCHGGKSSSPIFPLRLAPPMPYFAFWLRVRCRNVHSRLPTIRGPTSVMHWSPTH